MWEVTVILSESKDLLRFDAVPLDASAHFFDTLGLRYEEDPSLALRMTRARASRRAPRARLCVRYAAPDRITVI
jgi:hypothetical protein